MCERLLAAQCVSYAALRRALERQALAPNPEPPALTQVGPTIRPITEYQSFWEAHAQSQPTATEEEFSNAHVDSRA